MKFPDDCYHDLTVEDLKEGRFYSNRHFDFILRIEHLKKILDTDEKSIIDGMILTMIDGRDLERGHINGTGDSCSVKSFLKTFSKLTFQDAQLIIRSHRYLKVVEDGHIEEMTTKEWEKSIRDEAYRESLRIVECDECNHRNDEIIKNNP